MTKSVFLTGATGFLGKKLLNKLIRKNLHVFVLVRPKKGMSPEERVKQLVDPEYAHLVTLVEGDLMLAGAGVDESGILPYKDQIDLFIHSAAVVKFDDKYKEEHFQVNVEGTRRAIEIAKMLNVPQYYHVSTAYTTGKVMEAHEELHPIDGEFFNGYERTKNMTEHHVMDSVDESFRAAIFRPSIIIGDSKTGEADTNLTMYGLIKCVGKFYQDLGRPETGTYRILAGPDIRLNFVPVDVVCDAILNAYEQGVTEGIFHVTHPDGLLVKSMFASICRNLGAPENFVVPDAQVTVEDMCGRERLLNRFIATFLSYLNNAPVFYNPNTLELFAEAGQAYTVIDEEMLDFMIRVYTAAKRSVQAT
ncbi:SDR family oxidoreductase [Brevibacillus dissolubilis]|uniref:SDR family oxidoreductase n=1 Tax=Brevibacillus dissolubilis TaxID=1844116 RepID=UPI0011169548|nr:SDR family oxidoreductase [Brevibacillus dissolubilis]